MVTQFLDPPFPTTLPLVKGTEIEEDLFTEQKAQCKAKGGTWDDANKKCILPTPEPEPAPEPKPLPPAPEREPRTDTVLIRDEETGDVTGIRRGEESLLTSQKEAFALAEKEASIKELPIGGQADVVLGRQQEEKRQQLQQEGVGLASTVGATPEEAILEQLRSGITAGEVNYLTALAAGVPDLIPNLISGAGAGFAFSKGKTRGALPALLGVGNAIRGFYSNFVRDVQRQQSALIETPIRSLSETKPVLGELINAQNSNPQDAASNKQEFDNQLAFIDLEYERLKDLTDDDLNKFLGDTGINQMQEYEVFYQLDGERDRLIREMQLALANPDPARIKPTSITAEEIKKLVGGAK